MFAICNDKKCPANKVKRKKCRQCNKKGIKISKENFTTERSSKTKQDRPRTAENSKTNKSKDSLRKVDEEPVERQFEEFRIKPERSAFSKHSTQKKGQIKSDNLNVVPNKQKLSLESVKKSEESLKNKRQRLPQICECDESQQRAPCRCKASEKRMSWVASSPSEKTKKKREKSRCCSDKHKKRKRQNVDSTKKPLTSCCCIGQTKSENLEEEIYAPASKDNNNNNTEIEQVKSNELNVKNPESTLECNHCCHACPGKSNSPRNKNSLNCVCGQANNSQTKVSNKFELFKSPKKSSSIISKTSNPENRSNLLLEKHQYEPEKKKASATCKCCKCLDDSHRPDFQKNSKAKSKDNQKRRIFQKPLQNQNTRSGVGIVMDVVFWPYTFWPRKSKR